MKTKIAILFAFLILTGSVAGQEATKNAELNVRQPAWVDGDVKTTSIDGQNAYVASGENIRIELANANHSHVVDFGVSKVNASLTYDEEFDEYVFNPQGKAGTFEVYWTVLKTRSITVNNTTSTEQYREKYTALIKIEGGVAMTHISSSQLQKNQNMTELGRETSQVIGEIREMNLPFATNSGSDMEILQAMVTRYVNTGNPIRALTGNYTQIAILLVLTLGGLLWVLQYLGLFAWMVRSLRGRLNRFESIEAREGAIADRQASVDEKERKSALNNTDWNDIFQNDHIAYAFREAFGETPEDGIQKLLNTQLLPEVWMKERLIAMGKTGWTVDGETLVPPGEDGGEPIEPQISDVVDKVDWNSNEIRSFDLLNADFDPAEFDEPPQTLQLGELLDRLDIQMNHFENEKLAGEYLREYLEYVKQHGYTETDGSIDTSRMVLNQFLKLSQILGDRYGFPETHIAEQAVERAIIDWDPSEQARTFAKEVEQGRA